MRKDLPCKFFKTTLKAAIPFLAFIGMADFAQAQSGYNYRTVKSSNWNDITLWVRAPFSNPTAYAPITSSGEIPNRNSGNIEILDGHTVTYDYANNVDQIIIKAGGVLELPAGNPLKLYVAPSTDRLVVQGVSGKQGIFRNLGGTISFTDGSTAVNSNIEVAAYGKYEHAYNASVGTIPTATWDANSDIEFKMTGAFSGITLADYQTRGFNQVFGNVKWNTPTNTTNVDLKGVISNVQGNFEVVSTGTGTSGSSNSALILSSSGTYNLTIGKSLIVSGANTDLVFSTQAAATGGALNLTVGEGMQVTSSGAFRNNTVATPLKVLFTGSGNLQSSASMLNTNFEVAPASSITLNGDVTVGSATGTFLVNGTLKTGTYAVKGSGNFSLATGASLNIGSMAGITASGLSGNIQVSGIRTFSGLANYIYNGTAVQVTGSGLPGTVASLTINNAAGLSMTNTVVTSSLKMAEGVITTTATKGLTIAANGTVQMPSPDKVSYISGPISRTIDNSNYNNFVTLEFPVGKNGKYRPIELSIFQFDPITTYYTAEQFEQPYTSVSPLPGTIEKISAVRYFTISKSSAAEVTAQIKLNYGSDDGVTNYQKLTIGKYNSTNKWVDIGGTASGNGTGTITSDLFDNFSDFMLANKVNGTNPLPVELTSFTANANKNAIVLNWKTASEKNNDHFEIERSLDGKNFEKIASVKGNGTTSNSNDYTFTDLNPATSLNYYRLKQVDVDGTFQFSAIVSATIAKPEAAITVYPNPANNTINATGIKGLAQIRILNVLGQEVYRESNVNSQEANLKIGFLPAGTYHLLINDQRGSSVVKFIKTDQ